MPLRKIFFPYDKDGRKLHEWPVQYARNIDGQTVEVIIPRGDMSKLKFVLRGGDLV